MLHIIANASSGESGGVELDSHADSAVVGSNCYVLRRTGKTANVRGFSSELGKPLSVPFVDALVAYDDPVSGDTILLKIFNALYVKSLDSNLIPPFLLRLAGLEVNDCPKFLSRSPSIKDHSVYARDLDLRIPLQLKNNISYITTRTPVQDELDAMETSDITTLHLTPEAPSWNPHNPIYQEQEESMMNASGDIIQQKERT